MSLGSLGAIPVIRHKGFKSARHFKGQTPLSFTDMIDQIGITCRSFAERGRWHPRQFKKIFNFDTYLANIGFDLDGQTLGCRHGLASMRWRWGNAKEAISLDSIGLILFCSTEFSQMPGMWIWV